MERLSDRRRDDGGREVLFYAGVHLEELKVSRI
jgi:hypothetical protein